MINGEDEFGWGIVVNFQKKANQTKGSKDEPKAELVYVAEVLLYLSKETSRATKISAIKPCPHGQRGEMQVNLSTVYQGSHASWNLGKSWEFDFCHSQPGIGWEFGKFLQIG